MVDVHEMELFSVGKFVIHICDPQKCGEFLCIVPE
jgi:hypothetical protein